MTLRTDLDAEIREIFKSTWTERDGTVVPSDASIKLGNDGVNLDATVLYADMADSTEMVDNFKKTSAAEVYKAFLRAAAKIIKSEGGDVTAYDGDRVMAVFIGDAKNTRAVRTGLKINWATKKLVNVIRKEIYTSSTFELKHVVGIDTSKLLVARTGIRGANDLVWVGKSANYAAKMCALSHDYPTRITKAVYDNMNDATKYSGSTNMWSETTWNGLTIYRSTYWWEL